MNYIKYLARERFESMTSHLSKIDLIVDGKKIETTGKEVQLKIDGIRVYDDNLQNSINKLDGASPENPETLDVVFLMRIINGIFGHSERFRIVNLLKVSPKTFTEIQNCFNLKPATLDFHMKKLQNEMIISKPLNSKKYELTIIGESILEYFLNFIRKKTD
jgi:hypothetical protein